MITFSILVTLILIVAAIIAAIALTCGAGLFVLLGDLIVCGVILWAFVKLFKRK